MLEVADEALVDLDHRRRLRRREAEGLRLLVVVLQHEVGDRLLHLGEQIVALPAREVALRHDRVEQDLDVDLVIRAVDPRRVVDGVRVDPPAGERVLDSRALGETQVAALSTTRQRSSRASNRSASFALSPASACTSTTP